MADTDDAHSDTVMAAPASAPAANLATLDVASAGGELAARARLPIVPRELYEVLGEFARGGLGRIVRARDTRSGRLVALKEMLRGTPDAAARFEREAVVTANLQHPAIVPVYEVGRWPDGEPFFAMKLVQGRSLADAIAAAADREARLALLPHVIAVAEALSYAHAQGWIHRDLKPHNVLVGDHGETVVIDWGLARRASDQVPIPAAAAAESGEAGTDATIAGSVLGTPAYMAPEQAAGIPVDERADVYAIGAMLRHLLTGAPAFADSKNVQHLLERVRTSAPPALSDVAGWLPADLIAIVERAMARDVDARYATAGLLAEDLRRFTTGQLVAAHRYTRLERLRRFVRRNRAALAVAAVALTISIAYGAWSLSRIVDERDAARAATVRAEAATAEADRQRATATSRLAALYADRGRLELLDGRPQRALPYLAEAMRLGADSPAARFVIARALEQVDRVVARWSVPGLRFAMFAPDGDGVIVLDRDAVSRRAFDGSEVWRVLTDDAVAMTAVGTDHVAVGVPGGLLVLDAATGTTRHVRAASVTGAAAGLTATPDGNTVVAGYEDGTVRVWDLNKADGPRSFATGAPADHPFATSRGRVIVNGVSDQDDVPTTTWDLATGKRLGEPCPRVKRCRWVAVAPDGRVALGQITGNLGGVDHVELLDANLARVGGFELRAVAMNLALVDQLVLALGVRTLDAYALDGTPRWSVPIGKGGQSLAVTADGRRAVAATVSGEHTLIELPSGTVIGRQAATHRTDVVELSRDGSHALGHALDETITVWDARGAPVTPITTTAQRTWRVTWTDASTIVAGTEDGVVSIRDAVTGVERRRIQAHQGVVLTAQVWPGLGLITSSTDGTACRWDVGSGKQLACWKHGAKVRRAEPSPDRRLLATAGSDSAVKLWDVSTGAEIASWSMRRPAINVRWSPDGAQVAAIDEAGDVELHDGRSGAMLRDEPGVGGDMFAGVTLEFSADGAFVAAGRRATRPALIHATDPAADIPLEGADSVTLTFGIGFAPDGKRLAGAGTDQRLHVWDTATGRALQVIDTAADVHALAWSPDGEMVITGGADRLARVWDPGSGLELARLDTGGDVYTLQLSPDGASVAIGTDAPTALVWRLSRFDGTADELTALLACRGLYRLDGDQLLPQEPSGCP